VGESLGFENLLAFQEAAGIGPEALMRSLQAGSSSMQARRRAKIEPALEPPAGESWSSSSAQVTRRCTCIKRALVRTVGGAKHARRVCLSLPETRHRPTQNARRPGGAGNSV